MARGKQKLDAQKKNLERQAKLKKQAARKGNKGSSKNTVQCKICRMEIITSKNNVVKLKEHSDAKHPKLTFAQCFPCHTPEALAKAKNATPVESKYKADKPVCSNTHCTLNFYFFSQESFS